MVYEFIVVVAVYYAVNERNLNSLQAKVQEARGKVRAFAVENSLLVTFGNHVPEQAYLLVVEALAYVLHNEYVIRVQAAVAAHNVTCHLQAHKYQLDDFLVGWQVRNGHLCHGCRYFLYFHLNAGLQQFFLALEVCVHCSAAFVCGFGYVVHCNVANALLGKKLSCNLYE